WRSACGWPTKTGARRARLHRQCRCVDRVASGPGSRGRNPIRLNPDYSLAELHQRSILNRDGSDYAVDRGDEGHEHLHRPNETQRVPDLNVLADLDERLVLG